MCVLPSPAQAECCVIMRMNAASRQHSCVSRTESAACVLSRTKSTAFVRVQDHICGMLSSSPHSHPAQHQPQSVCRSTPSRFPLAAFEGDAFWSGETGAQGSQEEGSQQPADLPKCLSFENFNLAHNTLRTRKLLNVMNLPTHELAMLCQDRRQKLPALVQVSCSLHLQRYLHLPECSIQGSSTWCSACNHGVQ
jgi:hypothetical protein